MNLIEAIENKTGHAFLVEAGISDHEMVVNAVERGSGVTLMGNPDAYVRSYGQFMIDDARVLKEAAMTKALGNGRVFIISCGSITPEAQNALLKLLEEPGEGHIFVLAVPRASALLVTVRSRMQRVEFAEKRNADRHEARTFLEASLPKRLAHIGKILKEKNIEAASVLLDSLEQLLAKDMRSDPVASSAVRAILDARRYPNGLLSKPLMERVALVVPSLESKKYRTEVATR